MASANNGRSFPLWGPPVKRARLVPSWIIFTNTSDSRRQREEDHSLRASLQQSGKTYSLCGSHQQTEDHSHSESHKERGETHVLSGSIIQRGDNHSHHQTTEDHSFSASPHQGRKDRSLRGSQQRRVEDRSIGGCYLGETDTQTRGRLSNWLDTCTALTSEEE